MAALNMRSTQLERTYKDSTRLVMNLRNMGSNQCLRVLNCSNLVADSKHGQLARREVAESNFASEFPAKARLIGRPGKRKEKLNLQKGQGLQSESLFESHARSDLREFHDIGSRKE